MPVRYPLHSLSLVRVLLEILLPILVVVGLGYLAQRRLALSPGPFSRLTLYFLSPALVFSSLSEGRLPTAELGQMVLFAVLLTLVLGLVAGGLALLLRYDRPTRNAFLLGALFINAGNYGLPVNLFAFGQAGLDRAVVYFVTTAVLINTLGVFLASRGGRSVLGGLLTVLRMPLLYATLAGLTVAASGVSLPLWLGRPIGLIGQAAIPILLLVLGMQLAQARLQTALPVVGLATGVRLLGGMAVALGLSVLLGMKGVSRDVALVQSSMPTAVMTTVLALEFGVRPDVVTGTVLVSTLGSMVTLSLLLFWLLGG